MRCLTRDFGSVLAAGGWLASGSVLAVAGALTLSAALAQDSAQNGKPTNKGASAPAQASSEQVALPTCLAVLDLSPEQRGKIQEIIRDYDADVASVWKQFSDRYMEALRTEALLLCAIEDNLTEAQRRQVRDQRRRVAQREKSLAGTKGKPNRATEKPESAVEEQLAIVGVSLTPEQESAADKIQEGYLSRLGSLNRDIEGFHTRLLSLEADKFVEVEKILTKDQLQQLREIRQSAPSATLESSSQQE